MIKIIKTMVKGKFGEMKTSLTNSFLNSNFIVINDVMINNHKGSTTQIDHVILDIKNSIINVVETKNYKGDISGFVSDKYFESSYANGNKIFDFYNPLLQNYGHIKSIQSLIKRETGISVPLNNFQSIIYFNGSSRLNIHSDGKEDSKLFSINNIINNKKDYVKILKSPNIDGINRYFKADEIIKIGNIINTCNMIGKNKGFFNNIKHKIKHNNSIKYK